MTVPSSRAYIRPSNVWYYYSTQPVRHNLGSALFFFFFFFFFGCPHSLSLNVWPNMKIGSPFSPWFRCQEVVDFLVPPLLSCFAFFLAFDSTTRHVKDLLQTIGQIHPSNLPTLSMAQLLRCIQRIGTFATYLLVLA
ncbi:hypothetical protein F4802DRAFT_141467 [Xylaria palmicola]|nr:hypothetical protein F4802DRAFT_141467 [Xylaria palmicola]